MTVALENSSLLPGRIPPEVKDEIDAASAYVAGLTPRVTNDAEMQDAALVLRDISTKAKDLEKRRLDITRPMDAAKKSVMDLFAAPLNALQAAEGALKTAISRYQLKRQQEIAEQQRKLNEAAERERLERERIAEEHRRKAEAADTEAARDRYEKLAAAQEAKAVNIAPPVLAAPEKADGVSMRDNWTAEVFDIREVCAAVVRGELSEEAVMANMPYLNGLARALKQGMKFGGVRAVNTPTVAARRIG